MTARAQYQDYTKTREAMLEATQTADAPWTIVDFNDQRIGRLTLIRDLLDRLPDTWADPHDIDLPPLAGKPAPEKFGQIKPIKPCKVQPSP